MRGLLIIKYSFIKERKDCHAEFERVVQKQVLGVGTKINIRKVLVVSNTDADDSWVVELRSAIIDETNNKRIFGIKTPANWIHLEQQLHETLFEGSKIINRSEVVRMASAIVEPIKNDDDVENFLQHCSSKGIYSYHKSLSEFVVLDQEWLSDVLHQILNAFNCCQALDAEDLNEYKDHGRMRNNLVRTIIGLQEPKIKTYEDFLVNFMEYFEILIRQVGQDDITTNVFVPSNLHACSSHTLEEFSFSNSLKSSYLCIVFEHLPPYFAVRFLLAFSKHFQIATVSDKKTSVLYNDFAVYNLDVSGKTTLMIIILKNIIQLQILRFGEEQEDRPTSFHHVRLKVTQVIEELKTKNFQQSLPYTIKMKCKYAGYNSIDGLVSLKVINPKKDFYCEEHDDYHDGDEIIQEWFADNEDDKVNLVIRYLYFFRVISICFVYNYFTYRNVPNCSRIIV